MKFTCLFCGEKSRYNPSQARGKFCSTKCSGDYRRQEKTKQYKKMFKKGKLIPRKRIKRLLLAKAIKTNGRKCSVCKRKKWNKKPITLWLDHKDGNAGNTKPSNVRLICPNCDSQQPTFGAKNMGNGRKSRGLAANT